MEIFKIHPVEAVENGIEAHVRVKVVFELLFFVFVNCPDD
jgi:hypothetical protein